MTCLNFALHRWRFVVGSVSSHLFLLLKLVVASVLARVQTVMS